MEKKFELNDIVYTIHHNKIVKGHIGRIDERRSISNVFTHGGVYTVILYTVYLYDGSHPTELEKMTANGNIFSSLDEIVEHLKNNVKDYTHYYYEDNDYH